MPYADYSGFGRPYFEGDSDAVSDPNPAGYGDFAHEYFAYEQIASELAGQGTDPVICAGTAYGYTLTHLPNGWDVAAMDISSHAVTEAQSVTDATVIEGDATNATDVATLAGEVRGKPRWGMSEALLSCLTDDEAVAACENLRDEARDAIHFVWEDPNPDYYNRKSLAEWQTLCDPNGDDEWRSYNALFDYWPRGQP